MSENEKFEVWAQQFRKETGIWPPGKSRPRGMLPQDESTIRAEFFAYWLLHRWIPVAEIPQKIKGWIEFINPAMKDGSIGGICLGTYSNIRYIKRNYTHYRPIILPASELCKICDNTGLYQEKQDGGASTLFCDCPIGQHKQTEFEDKNPDCKSLPASESAEEL